MLFRDESADKGRRKRKAIVSLFAPSIFAILKTSLSMLSMPSTYDTNAVGKITSTDTITGATFGPAHIASTSVTAIVGKARSAFTTGESSFLKGVNSADRIAKTCATSTLTINDKSVRSSVFSNAV